MISGMSKSPPRIFEHAEKATSRVFDVISGSSESSANSTAYGLLGVSGLIV